MWQAWAEFKGRLRPGVRPDPASCKTRLRCALNKSSELQEVPERSRLEGPRPYKVYQLLTLPQKPGAGGQTGDGPRGHPNVRGTNGEGTLGVWGHMGVRHPLSRGHQVWERGTWVLVGTQMWGSLGLGVDPHLSRGCGTHSWRALVGGGLGLGVGGEGNSHLGSSGHGEGMGRGPRCLDPTGRQPLKHGGWQPQKEAGLSPTEGSNGDAQPYSTTVSGG